MKARARLRLIVIYLGAAIVLAGTVGPFLWLVSSSFQYERQLLNRPPQWLPNPIVLDSYREIFEGAILGEESGVPYQSRIFLRSFGNSFLVAGSVAGGWLVEIGPHLPFAAGAVSSTVGALCLWRLCVRLDARRAAG